MKTNFTESVEDKINWGMGQLLKLDFAGDVEKVVLSNGIHSDGTFTGTILHYKGDDPTINVGDQKSSFIKSDFKIFNGVLSLQN